jgi:hypothetical protein
LLPANRESGPFSLFRHRFRAIRAQVLFDRNLIANRYDTIEDRNTIVLVGRTSEDTTEQLHFDRGSGLLLRRTVSTRTAFSPIAEQATAATIATSAA